MQIGAKVVYVSYNDRMVLVKKSGKEVSVVHEHMTRDAMGNTAWNYKNEMPMNGGDFGGLSGYEGIRTF